MFKEKPSSSSKIPTIVYVFICSGIGAVLGLVTYVKEWLG